MEEFKQKCDVVSFALFWVLSPNCNMENGMMKVVKRAMIGCDTKRRASEISESCSEKAKQGVVVVMTVMVIEVELMVIIEIPQY